MRRRAILPVLLAVALGAGAAVFLSQGSAAARDALVYKDPYCGCCDAWVAHLRSAGFAVVVRESEDMAGIKADFAVPAGLRSCHTAIIGGYVVEGHVPAADIDRLLAERPEAVGLSVPGMPAGSPGMDQGPVSESYASVLFTKDAGTTVFARH